MTAPSVCRVDCATSRHSDVGACAHASTGALPHGAMSPARPLHSAKADIFSRIRRGSPRGRPQSASQPFVWGGRLHGRGIAGEGHDDTGTTSDNTTRWLPDIRSRQTLYSLSINTPPSSHRRCPCSACCQWQLDPSYEGSNSPKRPGCCCVLIPYPAHNITPRECARAHTVLRANPHTTLHTTPSEPAHYPAHNPARSRRTAAAACEMRQPGSPCR
eukprot:58073-Chlamydomonas_euryale.AAC.5